MREKPYDGFENKNQMDVRILLANFGLSSFMISGVILSLLTHFFLCLVHTRDSFEG